MLSFNLFIRFALSIIGLALWYFSYICQLKLSTFLFRHHYSPFHAFLLILSVSGALIIFIIITVKILKWLPKDNLSSSRKKHFNRILTVMWVSTILLVVLSHLKFKNIDDPILAEYPTTSIIVSPGEIRHIKLFTEHNYVGGYFSPRANRALDFIVTKCSDKKLYDLLNSSAKIRVYPTDSGVYWGDTIKATGFKPGYNPIRSSRALIAAAFHFPQIDIQDYKEITGFVSSINGVFPSLTGNSGFINSSGITNSEVITLIIATKTLRDNSAINANAGNMIMWIGLINFFVSPLITGFLIGSLHLPEKKNN